MSLELLTKSVQDLSAQATAAIREVRSDQKVLNEELKAVQMSLIELAQRSNNGALMMPSSRKAHPLSARALAEHEGLQRMAADRSVKSANVEIGALSNLLVRTMVTGDIQSTTDHYDNPAQFDARLGEVSARRLSIFDALPRIPVTSGSFTYNKLNNYTNQAAFQAVEGGAKTETAMPTSLVTVAIATLNHYLKLSDQVLADSSYLAAQVESLLRYGVLQKASAEIIAGTGQISGLQDQAEAFTPASDSTEADAIAQAIAEMDTDGWTANLIIMHPRSLQRIRTERSTNDQVYISGAGWAEPNVTRIWGVNVLTDPAVGQQYPLVLDTSQVAILDRMSARVEFGRTGTDFTDNVTTALAELRVGLAVFSPSAVRKVALW